MIKGVIFDMDGVLVDSESYICKAAILMFKELGLKVVPEDFIPFVGRGEDKYIGGVAEKYKFSIDIKKAKERTYNIYESIIKNNLQPLPGVFDFIKKTKDKNLKIAIATSADYFKMKINLENAKISIDLFDATVDGLEVENKKPNPEIFIRAAKKLNLNPNECLVVEDAINGVEAAKSAGAKCLALTTSFDEKSLNNADWIANDLSDVNSDVLEW